MDDSGNLIGVLLILAAVVAILYLIVIALTLIGGVTALIGVGWGGGTAFWNYGKSMKKNLIDSNFGAV